MFKQIHYLFQTFLADFLPFSNTISVIFQMQLFHVSYRFPTFQWQYSSHSFCRFINFFICFLQTIFLITVKQLQSFSKFINLYIHFLNIFFFPVTVISPSPFHRHLQQHASLLVIQQFSAISTSINIFITVPRHFPSMAWAIMWFPFMPGRNHHKNCLCFPLVKPQTSYK